MSMIFLFPSMTMLCIATFFLSQTFTIINQLLKVFTCIIKELFAWFCFLVLISAYTLHNILEHIFLPIIYLFWWINLCVCYYKECYQNKATMITLKKSKGWSLVPLKRNCICIQTIRLKAVLNIFHPFKDSIIDDLN